MYKHTTLPVLVQYFSLPEIGLEDRGGVDFLDDPTAGVGKFYPRHLSKNPRKIREPHCLYCSCIIFLHYISNIKFYRLPVDLQCVVPSCFKKWGRVLEIYNENTCNVLRWVFRCHLDHY